MSNVFAEIIRLRDRSLPPFSVALPHWFLEQHKQDEDEKTLEGHKDGEDVSEGKELFNFYHQNSNDPSNIMPITTAREMEAFNQFLYNNLFKYL